MARYKFYIVLYCIDTYGSVVLLKSGLVYDVPKHRQQKRQSFTTASLSNANQVTT